MKNSASDNRLTASYYVCGDLVELPLFSQRDAEEGLRRPGDLNIWRRGKPKDRRKSGQQRAVSELRQYRIHFLIDINDLYRMRHHQSLLLTTCTGCVIISRFF